MSFADAVIQSLILLATLVLTSLLDVIVLNFFLQAKNPRAHNRLKLLNECLARHQLSYVIWYITLMLLADFNKLTPHEAVVVKGWMFSATLLSLFFWLGGLNGIAGQDDAIKDHHQVCESARKCSKGDWRLSLVVLILNSSLALVSLGIAWTFVLRPATIHSLSR